MCFRSVWHRPSLLPTSIKASPGPIHETGDPAIDDPLTALVDIISEKDPASLVRSSLQTPEMVIEGIGSGTGRTG